jgi:Rps23 Pro-64 3,4-dihydroxylase Tpa1-like proline 4-hydroxylase
MIATEISAAEATNSLYTDEFAAKLKALAHAKAAEYAAAKPFPHIYFDDFLPIEAAEAALAAFPEPHEVKFTEFANQNEKKLAFESVEKLPAPIRDVLFFLNSRPMVQFLEILTGIKGVIPDPYYVGGGLHQIKPGGHLEVHADFNWHEELQLDRRINVLVYLNKDWHESYGGHFELWDREMKGAEAKILPLFNRCAIFSTTDFSFHGHPTPLSCPPDRFRRSMATYYYSNGRPAEEVSDSHTTVFKSRPGAAPVKEATNGKKSLLHQVTPPIIADAVRKIRNK